MATVAEILRRKGSQVHTVDQSATVLDAVRVMNRERVGCVVVMCRGRIAGIFTERDVLRRVVESQRRPAEIPVADVMTEEVLFRAPETTLEEVGRVMKDHRVRHLPICDHHNRLVGLISIGDLNAYYASDQEETIHSLREFMYGAASL